MPVDDTMEEMIRKQLVHQLGRKPTEAEVQSFMPPSEAGITRTHTIMPNVMGNKSVSQNSCPKCQSDDTKDAEGNAKECRVCGNIW